MNGTEIICINDSHKPPIEIIPNWIEKDKIYTIRGIQNSIEGNGFGLLLEEVENPKLPAKLNGQIIGYFEPGFHTSRFKLLNGDKLSLTISETKKEVIN